MAKSVSATRVLRAGRSPLVGRTQQLDRLQTLLAEACAGQPAVVLLSGAPGIGKTRLLEEFATTGMAGSLTVLRGGASQAEGMPPYLPFLEALGGYIRATPAGRLGDELGESAVTLSRLLPEIAARLTLQPQHHVLPSEQERFRLFEAVTAFLAAIAMRQPLLLILDDLQWSDAATRELLVHVAGRLRGSAVLIVGSYRSGEVSDDPGFSRMLAGINRLRLLTVVALQPLDAAGSQAISEHLLGGAVAEDLSALLHKHSEGNPFFLEELLRGLADGGFLVLVGGRWTLERSPESLLPPRIAEAIRLRYERLDPAVVEALRVAAVVGRSFDTALLATVLEMQEDRVEGLLQIAEQYHLTGSAADGTLAFSHDMVRETLYSEIGRVRRKRLHRAIGEALEARDADEESLHRRLADLAFHFSEAGEPSRGVAYALESGDCALRASAPDDAMQQFATVVRLLGPGSDRVERAAALSGLGDAATLTGKYAEAVAAYLEAQEEWLKQGDQMAAARAWQRMGIAHWRQEAVEDARRAFERALDLYGSQDNSDAAETLLQLADLSATSLGQNARATAYAEQAVEMVERLGDRRLEAAAYCVLGNVQARGNDLRAGKIALERALALATEIDDPTLAAESCAYLANTYAWMGEIERSIAVSIRRADLARRTHDLYHLRHVYSWIGLQHVLQGNWVEAERNFAEHERTIAGLQSPEPQASLQLARSILLYFQTRFDEASSELDRVVDLLRPTGSSTLIWYLGWSGLVLTELGRADDAVTRFEELLTLAESLDERAGARGAVYAQLAVGFERLGERDRAAGCYQKLAPFKGQIAPILIDRGLGIAAAAEGNVAAARLHFMDAERLARRAGMRPEARHDVAQSGAA